MLNNNIRQQIFQLNNHSLEELQLKWIELFKTECPYDSKSYLIKELSYQIQLLQGQSSVSENEVKLTTNIVSKNLNKSLKEENKKKQKSIIMLPPAGSVLTRIYKGIEYRVKIIAENKFECNGMIYKSLSSLAFAITGTKWNGYTFFKLKKTVN